MTTQSSEIRRQQKYLDKLPKHYQYPLFNTMQALKSQRQNGYRNTAAAAREIVDNAIEAGAEHVDVLLKRPDQRNREKNQRKGAVSAIAFVDDGPGMLPAMARYALSWGGGTHFEDHEFIGKFGFGLPNASINQTTKVQVFTRTDPSEPITLVTLDLTSYKDHGLQQVPEPETIDELPDFVQAFLNKAGRAFETGTVVVWDRPDRLSYRLAAALKEHMLDDFGSTYRNHLDRFELTIDGTRVEPVDPLFTDPGARLYVPPEEGGAQTTIDRSLPVRYYEDTETGGRHLIALKDESEMEREGERTLTTSVISVRVVRLPVGFAVSRGRGTAPATDANRRFTIRQSRRGMSFVRAGREIEVIDAFPRSEKDKASGLGDWPLLQGYAYHWGIEVAFDPVLDDAFGITNDKQTVRPLEDFWRILRQEEIDKALNAENTWQRKQRKKDDVDKAKEKNAQRETTPTAGERAAADADLMRGRRRNVPKNKQAEVDNVTELEVKRRAEETNTSEDEVLSAMNEERRRRPFKVTFADDPNGPFFTPRFGVNRQVLVEINQLHPFFTDAYSRLGETMDGVRGRDAIDLLLFALASSELETDDEFMSGWYEAQRRENWSAFLRLAFSRLDAAYDPSVDDDEDQEKAA